MNMTWLAKKDEAVTKLKGKVELEGVVDILETNLNSSNRVRIEVKRPNSIFCDYLYINTNLFWLGQKVKVIVEEIE